MATDEPVRHENPFRQSVRILGLYVKGTLLIAALVTVLYAIGYAIIGVPVWLLIAILSGVLNVIPRVGSLVALLLAALVSWFVYTDDLWILLKVLAVWVIVQTIEGFILTPKILGKSLNLSAWSVFVALLLASFLFGPIGFLLTVPALAIANVFWQHHRKRQQSGIR